MRGVVAVISRSIGRLLVLSVLGYLMSSLVTVTAIGLLLVLYGSLDAGLESLSKSPSFSPAMFGHFAAVMAAGVATITGGVLRIAAERSQFRRTVRTRVVPVAALATVVATAAGVGMDIWGLAIGDPARLALATGVWIGVVFPLAVWAVCRFLRGPAEPE